MLEAVSDDHLFVVPAMAGQMQKRVCEGKTMSIKCAKGVISVVKASYGRQHGKEVCPSTAIKTQDCHAVSSLKKVKQFCEGKSSCSVQSTNTHFGDPCGGTHKYLTVQYVCKAGKPAGKSLCGNTSVFCCEFELATLVRRLRFSVLFVCTYFDLLSLLFSTRQRLASRNCARCMVAKR